MSANDTEKLAHMANQIAAFFAVYGEEEAAAGVAEHINRFWSRPMRAAFVAAGGEQTDLAPAAARALANIKT
ncbi:MAG: formate dehydrogenase subunit delta [Ancalomicrobiaceae bacterium]|nr:formate dehydrogenase subunit delta [Ancalomicrobiaceae bacterium]